MKDKSLYFRIANW